MSVLAISNDEVLAQVTNALSLGSTYALLALGLAMVFSVVRLVNFAHGELVTVAAYSMYLLHGQGVPFVFQVPAAIAAGCLASVLMERAVFRPLRGSSFVTLLIASFAVSIIIQNLLRAFVSPRQRGLPLPDLFNEVLTIGPVSIGWLQIMTTLTTFAALGVLVFFLRRSLLGVSMLAAAQDFQTSRLMGIRANRVISTAFAISGALAGIAAVFLVARRGIVDPVMGFNPLLKAFIAVVIGGLGSLPGAVVGGFVLGAIEVALATGLPTEMLPFRDALALTVVILILYVRPDGLVSRPAEAH